MKKTILPILLFIGVLSLFAGDYIFIFKTDQSVFSLAIAAIDSIKFSPDQTLLDIYKTDQSVGHYSIAELDSITFGGINEAVVSITYSGNTVMVTNPYQNKGINITIAGADVMVNSTLADTEVNYLVSGESSDGMLKVYSKYKFRLSLKGVTLTNVNGPAINIQSTKKCTLELTSGTTNTLADGVSYSTSTEDQKSTLFSEGQLIVKGTGTLNISSKSKHAICSDDYIEIEEGEINITSAAKDGIHTNDHYNLEGGTVTVAATGDAVECEAGNIKISGGNIIATISTADTKGLKSDSTLLISGGNINFTVSGNQSKGLKSAQNMTLSGGNINITTSGAAVLAEKGIGYDPSYCTAIKSDSSIVISGATISITTSGKGNKAISADNNFSMTDGNIKITGTGIGSIYTNSLGVAEAYGSCGIDADGNISIISGRITLSESGSAAKGISADGNLTIGDATHSPEIYVKNSGTRLLVSGTDNYISAVYSDPKNIKSDGILTIANGIIGVNAIQQGATAIDSDSLLYVTGGIVNDTISGAKAKGLKSGKAMYLNGGTINIKASGNVVLEYTTSTTLLDPSYCTAIKSDTEVNLNGANINITHSGTGGKGISADNNITMNGGNVQISTSGGGSIFKNATNVTDAYSAACFTSDTNISIAGGTVNCASSGSGGKGISANGSVTIGTTTTSPTVSLTTTGAQFIVSTTTGTGGGPGGGTVYNYCHPKTLKADGNIIINNGNNTISSTDDGIKSETSITINGGNTIISKATEGIEAKIITINGGNTNITASDDGVNTTASTQAGGTESNDGSYLYMNGGVLTAVATSGDAIDSNGTILMTGGVMIGFGPSNSTNEDIDANGTITINGGLLFGGCMNSGMFESISSSAQVGVNLKSTSAVSTASGFIQIKDASGTVIGTFKTPLAYYYFHLSSPDMKVSTAYSIYTGGTYTGGTTTGGYCTGGTYSGGTLKKTFTTGTSKVSTLTL